MFLSYCFIDLEKKITQKYKLCNSIILVVYYLNKSVNENDKNRCISEKKIVIVLLKNIISILLSSKKVEVKNIFKN